MMKCSLKSLGIALTMMCVMVSSSVFAHRSHSIRERLREDVEELREKNEKMVEKMQFDKQEDALVAMFNGISGGSAAVGLYCGSDIAMGSIDSRFYGILLADYFVSLSAAEKWLDLLGEAGICQSQLAVIGKNVELFIEASFVYSLSTWDVNYGPGTLGYNNNEIALAVFESASIIGDTLFRCTGDPCYANSWRQMAMYDMWGIQAYLGVLENESVDSSVPAIEGAYGVFAFESIKRIIRAHCKKRITIDDVFLGPV